MDEQLVQDLARKIASSESNIYPVRRTITPVWFEHGVRVLLRELRERGLLIEHGSTAPHTQATDAVSVENDAQSSEMWRLVTGQPRGFQGVTKKTR